ncbi:hypothetical protein PAPHI01_2229 [Pancytospora philotis]|nr:hypothetical protein PAPHI01_2229 [Pancytospora philotis]
MHLSQVVISLLVQYIMYSAATQESTSDAANTNALSRKSNRVSRKTKYIGDSTINALYNHSRDMRLLDFFAEELHGMSQSRETDAKADAILLAWLTVDTEPKALEQRLQACRFSHLIMLKTMLAAENVERVCDSVSSLRSRYPKQRKHSRWPSKRNAGVLLEAVEATILLQLDSADTCELFKMKKDIEGPYDLFLHLYMRSHYKKEPLVHGFSALLTHLLHDCKTVHSFNRYALPFVKVLSEQNLVTGSACDDLERAVIRVAATAYDAYVMNIYRRVRFRVPLVDLLKRCILDEPDQYAHPMFIQEFINLCAARKLIDKDEKIALYERYAESDKFFMKETHGVNAARLRSQKLSTKFLCHWIFKRFIINYTDSPKDKSYLQRLLDILGFDKLTETLCYAFGGKYKTYIRFFLTLMPREYLEEFDAYLGDLEVVSRYGHRFYFELKQHIGNIQQDRAPLNTSHEQALPHAKRTKLGP